MSSFADVLESICAKSLLITENTMTKKKNLTRRNAMSQLAAGLIAGNVANLTAHALSKGKNDSSSSSGKGSGKGKGKGGNGGGNDDGPPTTLRFTPFSVPLPLPPVKQPLAIGNPPFQPGAVFHGIAPEYFDRRVAEQPELERFHFR